MKRLLLAMIGTCVLSTSALALDQSSFSAKVEKQTGVTNKIRALCICKQSGIYNLKAGYLTSLPSSVPSSTMVGIGIACSVPLFYSGGNVAQIARCTSFEVIAK